MMSVTGEPDGPPAKCGVPVGDFVAGLYASLSIAAALRRREITGEGAILDCSMLASLLSVSSLQVSQFVGTGVDPDRLGSTHPRNAPYQGYECVDGYITVAAGNESLWKRFCDVIDQPELVDDERFIDQTHRALNQTELEAEVAPILRSRTRSEWLEAFGAKGIPSGPVNTFGEVIEDPQVQHLGLIPELLLPNGTWTKGVAFPVLTDAWDVKISRPPKLGEHTEEVLREWIEK